MSASSVGSTRSSHHSKNNSCLLNVSSCNLKRNQMGVSRLSNSVLSDTTINSVTRETLTIRDLAYKKCEKEITHKLDHELWENENKELQSKKKEMVRKLANQKVEMERELQKEKVQMERKNR